MAQSGSQPSTRLRPAVAGYRLAVAALMAVALGFTAYRAGFSGSTGLVNFFSYFTILSNILGTVVFLVGGIGLLRGGAGAPDLLRGAAALYLVITGIVYGVALAHYDTPQVIPWVNAVVHKLTPLVFLLDWLLDPPRRPLRLSRAAVAWLALPVVFLVYSLARGPAAGWYPYPFLDPRGHGYLRVAVSCVIVAVAFVAAGAGLLWAGRALRTRRATTTTAVKPAHSQH
ncbi:MAG TPA: Pr6Pr family membrane protein [Actinocrinis sp.]|nr:Pr6Pr family membrane protein [Actinocrinis sp.]